MLHVCISRVTDLPIYAGVLPLSFPVAQVFRHCCPLRCRCCMPSFLGLYKVGLANTCSLQQVLSHQFLTFVDPGQEDSGAFNSSHNTSYPTYGRESHARTSTTQSVVVTHPSLTSRMHTYALANTPARTGHWLQSQLTPHDS